MKKEMQLKLPWFPILDILLVILLGVVLFGCGSKKDNNNNNNNNNVVVQKPTVILTASETSIWRGKKITLSWEAKNANSCKAVMLIPPIPPPTASLAMGRMAIQQTMPKASVLISGNCRLSGMGGILMFASLALPKPAMVFGSANGMLPMSSNSTLPAKFNVP
ncbi:hypothetical protein HZC33_01190 [Candidatus Wolfebacteria bacterium]|nr:hypothetical protein [Candidatus Wolfebacteria bacterium]